MGLKGIENSVTRFDDVFVPNEDVIGGEGKGLRIALTTLNTGRLSLPAICLSATKYSLKIAREWSAERKQWGQPDRQARPDRAEARLHRGHGVRPRGDARRSPAAWPTTSATTSASRPRWRSSTGPELGWTAVDEMVQVRGGRGYETAESLRRRGEKPVPAEQMLRDMRINRIFEGSDRDHAPADRARGRRPAPAGGGRHAASADAAWPTRPRPPRRRARSTPGGSRR